MSTRWYVPAYRAPNGSVQRMGHPTVALEHAQAEVESIRTEEARHHDGNPTAIFVATRVEHPWEPLAEGQP